MFDISHATACFTRFLEKGLERCPILTAAVALLLTGAGMVLAVVLAVFLASLPLGLLLGWF
ncbi:hypothetical protein [Lawsonibacter celer]|uniref:hypothetical protein n=1 Tax=Lawsonibacter celer TaxID=2986526 RepID=UPI0016444641|nr:hypothetical protein [Lawsonibacter celer]